jgi:hypothetical protein
MFPPSPQLFKPDSLHLFESRLPGLHGLLMMRQSEEEKWSILHSEVG